MYTPSFVKTIVNEIRLLASDFSVYCATYSKIASSDRFKERIVLYLIMPFCIFLVFRLNLNMILVYFEFDIKLGGV